MLICYQCKKEYKVDQGVGRLETCSSCHADLHVCYNCEFYDPKAYNECHESQADRVLDKDKANFCDYFKPGTASNLSSQNKDEKLKALESLFKK